MESKNILFENIKYFDVKNRIELYIREYLKQHLESNDIYMEKSIKEYGILSSLRSYPNKPKIDIVSIIYVHRSYFNIIKNTLVDDIRFLEFFELVNSFMDKSTDNSFAWKIIHKQYIVSERAKKRKIFDILQYAKKKDKFETITIDGVNKIKIEVEVEHYSLWMVFTDKETCLKNG